MNAPRLVMLFVNLSIYDFLTRQGSTSWRLFIETSGLGRFDKTFSSVHSCSVVSMT
jgi:hypothetical protein